MSYALVVEPEAEAAVDSALEVIKEDPFQFQLVYGPVRRANIRRYPHGLMYIVLDREVVLSCFHGRRDPARWQEPTS
jgi:hypothetical protein